MSQVPEEEFSPEEVAAIVSEALAIEQPEAARYIPLAFNEGRLLERLAEILPKYPVGRADIQMILSELREELYSQVSPTNIRTLHSVTKNCKRCPNMAASATLPSWNVVDPDCVFVADSPLSLYKDTIDHLVSSLSKVGFKSRSIALTYVNRCPSKDRKYSPQDIANCLGYLHTELQLMKPKLIVPLGLVASSAVLSAPLELGEERGKIIWVGPWAVMCTWAPGYALRSKGHADEQLLADLQTAFNFTYGRSE